MRSPTQVWLVLVIAFALTMASRDALAQMVIMSGPTRVAPPETATEAMRAIMPADQTALADALDLLPDRDLMALIEGVDPALFSLAESDSLRGSAWRTMIVAY